MNQLYDKKNIKAVILDSGCDFGRCPLASQLAPALWPVVDKPAIEHLLDKLADYGIKQTVICLNSDQTMVSQAAVCSKYSMDIRLIETMLPTGTAGCIRDAAGDDRHSLLLVLPISMTCVPNIDRIIQSHIQGGCEMTAILNPAPGKNGDKGHAAGIYVCEPTVLDYIPQAGYYDIKESLIPELLRAGKNIFTAELSFSTGNFRNYSEYLHAVSCYLRSDCPKVFQSAACEKDEFKTVWKYPGSQVDPSVRIFGPVVIMEGARILEGAVIFGPAVIGRHTVIGRDTIAADSIFWDYSQAASNCRIEECVVASHSAIQAGSVLVGKPVLFNSRKSVKHVIPEPLGIKQDACESKQTVPENKSVPKEASSLPPTFGRAAVFLGSAAVVLAGFFVWSNWAILKDLWIIWQRSDEYSSGLLVPFLALYVIWSRRSDILSSRIQPSVWGLLLFLAAQGIRFFGLFFMYISLERISVVAGIAGLVWMLFGWSVFRKAFTSLVFLCLMLPLPVSIHNSLILPLQSWSTASAVFCLEVLGYDVIRQGNIIDINGTTVAVAEACNGLRMIMAFFVIGAFMVLLTKRALWEKILVFASGIPIALICNTIRLVVTAIAFTIVRGEQWEEFFHDFGGYAMMPLAIGIIMIELWLLAKLVITKTETQIVSANR